MCASTPTLSYNSPPMIYLHNGIPAPIMAFLTMVAYSPKHSTQTGLTSLAARQSPGGDQTQSSIVRSSPEHENSLLMSACGTVSDLRKFEMSKEVGGRSCNPTRSGRPWLKLRPRQNTVADSSVRLRQVKYGSHSSFSVDISANPDRQLLSSSLTRPAPQYWSFLFTASHLQKPLSQVICFEVALQAAVEVHHSR